MLLGPKKYVSYYGTSSILSRNLQWWECKLCGTERLKQSVLAKSIISGTGRLKQNVEDQLPILLMQAGMGKAHQIRITSKCNNEKVSKIMKKTLLLIFFVFMVLLLSACGDTTQSTPLQTTSAPTTQPTSEQVTKVPTAPPKPTINLNLAILGGSIHAFDQKFGSNSCCYRNGWTPPNGPYVAVEDDTYNGLNVDETSLNRVVLIEIQPQSDGQTTVWSASNATSICNAYLPPDAKYQSSFLVPLADLTKGSVKVYYSTLLANSLPAKDFVDRNGKQGKPGTIYVYFDYHYDASHIGGCILDLQGNDSLWA